jgi:alkylhydroperoxidase family enzyme
MPRIDLPDGPGDSRQRALSLRPTYSEAWDACTKAVFIDSTLPWRMGEAVRYRLAQINGCLVCKAGRWKRGEEEGFTEEVYEEIATYESSAHLSDAEKLAIAFAERFALDHESLDDAFFEQLRAVLTDDEIVDLGFLTARHLAFGRFTHVLGLDDHCDIGTRTWTDDYVNSMRAPTS